MSIAVIGGVVSSTLLSLVVVPVFYLAIEALKTKLFDTGPALHAPAAKEEEELPRVAEG
jgi:hypothetical protein